MTERQDKIIIFLIGLFFRLFLVIYILASNPYHLEFFSNPSYQGSDQADFALITKNIVEHGVFSFSKQAPFVPDQFRTPLFPLFMTLSYWLTRDFILFSLLNILISSLIGVIVYKMAHLLFEDKKIAFWGGLIFAFLPYGAYLSTMAMADNLFVFFFVSSIFFIARFLKSVRLFDLLWGGIFLGLTTLTRPATQYLIIFIILFLLFLRLDFRKKITAILIIFLSFMLILSPWLIRNYIVFKKPMLSSLAGYHMFVSWIGPYRAYVKDHISRSEEATKLYQYIQDKYGKYGSEAMYDPAISVQLGEESKKEILQNLSTYVPFHLWSGVIYFMNNDIILTLSEVFKINSGNIYIVEKITSRDWPGLWKNLSQLNYFYIFIYFLSYFLIFSKNILALVGLKRYYCVSLASPSGGPILAILVLSILIYFPLLIGPEGHARFRYPVEPFLLIFAIAVILRQGEFAKKSVSQAERTGFSAKSRKSEAESQAAISSQGKLTASFRANSPCLRKFIYIANARIPTEKAHGIQIMNMCEAFAVNGLKVELVVPARSNKIKKDPFDYYGVKRIFKIKKLPVIDFIWLNLPFAFILETITFTISVFFYLLFQRNYILYTRGEMILGLRPFLTKWLTFWETHIKPDNILSYQKLFKNISGFITVTEYYKKELIEKYKVPAERILRCPDGVDLEKFDIKITREEARRKLNLPLDKKTILYTGSFMPWKGTDIFLEISGFLPNDVLLVLVASGEKEDIEKFKKSINASHTKRSYGVGVNNFLFLEHRPYQEIPYYLKAADLLILTGTKESEISLHYTSPLKLFEYMASDRPILSADIDSFREILDEHNAFFYEANNFKDLAMQINNILNNYHLAEQKAKQALEDVQNFTWQKRAEKIWNFIKARL